MKNWMIDGAIAAGSIALFVAFLVWPALSAEPVRALVQSVCPTVDTALAVIEGGDAYEKNLAFTVGECFFSPVVVSVSVVAIRGAVIWAGDGLDDLMYLIEIEAGPGNFLYTWLIASEWPDLKAQLRGDAI